MRYSIIGAAGYVAERHVQAIKNLGGEVVAICDPHSSVGYIDRYFPNCQYYNHCGDCLRSVPVDYAVICTPNDLHFGHTMTALNRGYNVICEKPLATSSDDLKELIKIESQNKGKVYTILQLRHHPRMIALKKTIQYLEESGGDIFVEYSTPRGDWYDQSWKGHPSRSGGLLFNIGIHLFDLLGWMLGEPLEYTDLHFEDKFATGRIKFKKSNVRWRLSTDHSRPAQKVITLNGVPRPFGNGFENLHQESHLNILEGNGFGIRAALPATLMIEQMHHQQKKGREGTCPPSPLFQC